MSNLTTAIRESTWRVVQQAQHVSIEKTKLSDFVSNQLIPRLQTLSEIRWDSDEDLHYFADAATDGPLTCQYIMVLDALNFCFWPTAGMEYEHLARGLKHALEKDPTALNAERLASIDSKTVAAWFSPYDPPQLQERTRKVREVGNVLLEFFDGWALNMVKKSDHSVVKLLQLVFSHFPGFQDHSIYNGEQVFLLKRAQILVGDIWGAYGRRRNSGVASFTDIEQLTMFADYRVPQLLHSEGVLTYSTWLEERIDKREELYPGSMAEVEIRSATIHAVELIQQHLKDAGHNVLVIEVDWLLWQIGEDSKDQIRPHHRTLSTFY